VQRQLGDSAALGTFNRYIATGEVRALGALELGRTQLHRGDRLGATRYYSAAADDNPQVRAALLDDLAPVASEVELAEFAELRGNGRVEWLRRFWSTRDRIELHRDGERLVEHFRRLAKANREFLVVIDGAERLDDRGRIYLRHGEPAERVRLAMPGVEPNESWGYRRRLGQANLIVHFVARHSPNHFELVESLQDIVTVFSPDRLFRSRAPLDPFFQQIPSNRSELALFLNRERAMGEKSSRIAAGSDSYPGFHRRLLQGWGTVAVAGATRASPILQVVFSIPRSEEKASDRVRLRFVALDTLASVVASIDTVLSGRGEPSISSDEGWNGVIPIAVRAGRLMVHAAVEVGESAGFDLGIDTLVAPSPGTTVLELGNLLVGSSRDGIAVPIGDGNEFRMAPGGLVTRSDRLELSAAVFGLRQEQVAGWEVQIRSDRASDRWRAYPDDGARGRIVRGSGTGPVVTARASLATNRLRAGRWHVALVVTSQSGTSTRQEAVVELRDP
jgi:GWxTD domain-containing protein